MTQQEFEKITGTEVTPSSFDYINRVYMAAGDIDKSTFCKDWLNEYVSESKIVSYLTMTVEEHEGTIKNLERQVKQDAECLQNFTDQMVDFLILQAEKWSATDLREKAIKLVGIREYLRRKIEYGFELWKADREALSQILKSE